MLVISNALMLRICKSLLNEVCLGKMLTCFTRPGHRLPRKRRVTDHLRDTMIRAFRRCCNQMLSGACPTHVLHKATARNPQTSGLNHL